MSEALHQAWAALRSATAGGTDAAARLDRALSAGTADPAADELLASLAPVALAGEPFAIGQLGQSLDGRICTETGDSHYVNGREALIHLHRLRALVDCVLVGVGTVVRDRPRLTVRHVPGDDPVRAVLDPAGRAPPTHSPLAPGPDEPRTLHLVGPEAAATLPAPPPHVERLAVPLVDGVAPPVTVLGILRGAGCGRVLVEGGATTLSRFFAAGALDRLHLLVAPLLLGSGRAGLQLAPVAALRDAARPPTRRFPLGGDTLFDVSLGKG